MKTLIQWSIEHHWMVLIFSVLLFAAGVWTARDMPVDVFPDLTAPTVTILSDGRGHRRRVGGIRLGHRHFHGATGRRRKALVGRRHAAATGRASRARADLVD